ncbi:MAG: nickel pincer cofactor biosynthesis protein LarB [Candidatus Desulforudis sp.]|nr:nickel pincer cofactor biosynthesis protein LarB [Desulforudis sp.]
MNKHKLLALLREVAAGRMDVDRAAEALRHLPYEEVGIARLDHHRALRKGFPEVIFCEGKTPSQAAQIFFSLMQAGEPVLATRADHDIYRAVRRVVPRARYHARARCITLGRLATAGGGPVLILSAGTADLPVAEEAEISTRIMGHGVTSVHDVGVAGLHRLLAHHKLLETCRVVIAVAGMEGALPSVVAGLTPCLVIAVPTSVGYGAGYRGLAALLTMLNSCAPVIGVVNIDNGYGAAALAAAIIRSGEEN